MIRSTLLIATLIPMLTSTFPKTLAASEPDLTYAPGEAKVRELENGLTIIVKEDRSAPVASVQAWCHTGSIHEDKWLGAGLSHILEHMLFKGTETRSTNAIAQTVQDHGGYVNAYTSFDRTVYYIDVPKAGVTACVDVLADAMMNSTLPAEEYVKEQEVIRREFAMGNDSPERTGQKLLFATAFSEHPYRQPVIGYMDVYNQLTRDDVMEYYKKRYVPNNLFFVVTGDVNAEAVFAQLETFFKDFPRQKLEPIYIPQEPLQLGKRVVHEEFPTQLSRLSMAWHVPGLTHLDMPALDLLATVLGNGRSSRLYREIRENQGLVHSISAYSYTPKDGGLFGVQAVCDPDQREKVEAEVMKMLAALISAPVTEKELTKAKKLVLSGQFAGLVTASGQASDLGSNWLLTHNLDFTKTYLDGINAVTVADLQRVAKSYLVDRTLNITSLNPVGSLADGAEVVSGDAGGDIQRITLDNGMRLLVREDARLPLVSATVVFAGGVRNESVENNGISRMVSQLLLKGTTSRSGEEIASEIEGVGGSIGSESGYNSFAVSVEVMKPDVKLGFELMADVLLNPIFPEAALEREKRSQIAAIKDEQERVVQIAFKTLRENIYGDHPYGLRPLGSEESVSGFDRQAIVDFYQQSLDPKNCVVSVFGDVKADEVKKWLEAAFAEIDQRKGRVVEMAQPAPLAKSVNIVEEVDKQQAVLAIGYFGVDIFDEDRLAMELIDEACSDLGSRFFVRIREDLGLAYYVGSSQAPGLVRGLFQFYVGTDPAKVDLVKKEFTSEIAKLAAEGLTEVELKRAKVKLIGGQEIRNQSNHAFGYATALDELYGLGYQDYLSRAEKINAITLEQVKAVTQKYFHEKNAVTVVVQPPAAEEKDQTSEEN